MQRFLDSLSFSQPYLVGLLFMVVVVFFMPGCATASADSAGRTRNFATIAATTAGGAYISARKGDGKAKNAAVGAAVGLVVGETINYFNNKAQREAYLAGYE
jgi:ABC-type xylose transport system permease subunit